MQHTVQISQFNSEYHKDARLLRAEVLRKPLGLAADDPAFSDREADVHFITLDNAKVVGIVVLVPDYKPGVGKLRQMATAKHVRGKGYGVALVQALEKHATEIGIEKIVLHSRHYAVGFYEKLGYQVTSDVFQEVGINHFMMNKQL